MEEFSMSSEISRISSNPDKPVLHQVQEGDTFYTIADKYGVLYDNVLVANRGILSDYVVIPPQSVDVLILKARPKSPPIGQMWFDTEENTLNVFTTAGWVTFK
jgi:LysM repeat protein